MSKFELKKQAVAMRKKGASLGQIMSSLNISKSTASYWCREIELTEKQSEVLFKKMIKAGHVGRMIGAQSNMVKKIISMENAHREMENLLNVVTDRDLFISGISLYWAEGSKASSTSGFIFVNSDPTMIKLMCKWLLEMMNVDKNDIYIHVSINEMHRNREGRVLNFWSNLLDLPLNQFSNTFFAKTKQKKVYENYDEYYGVCRLGVRRSSYLKYKILALIDILKAGVAVVVS